MLEKLLAKFGYVPVGRVEDVERALGDMHTLALRHHRDKLRAEGQVDPLLREVGRLERENASFRVRLLNEDLHRMRDRSREFV